MSQNPGVGTSSGAVQPVSTKTSLVAQTPTTATVGTTSSTVVATNASRKGCSIINLSVNVVSLAFGVNNAVLNRGITLTNTGSVYEMSEYDYTTSQINAIASDVSSVIAIQEWQ